MSDVVIRVEGLGKRYRLGQRSAPGIYDEGFRHVLQRAALTPWRGLARLCLRARENADRDGQAEREFYALCDVTFDVRRGEVVGILGRNGAGKSTLLKILSRITEPTHGRVGLKGRIASLLEVGTGFHSELTGRENIFLNGAILGMSRREVRAKFDEMVAFAAVEKFLDTPVKHYSSGMYVRLAFAVAAHLESEILIIDEVLAVGDMQFQKKCLGKMSEVAQSGRTVLFVSHNLSAVRQLTTSGVVLHEGRVIYAGTSRGAVQHFTQSLESTVQKANNTGRRGEHATVLRARLVDAHRETLRTYEPGEPMLLALEVETDGTPGLSLEAFLHDGDRTRVGFASLYQFHAVSLPIAPGRYACEFRLEGMWLAAGSYSFDISTSVTNRKWDHYVENAISFEVPACSPGKAAWEFQQSLGFGPLALQFAEPRFEAL